MKLALFRSEPRRNPLRMGVRGTFDSDNRKMHVGALELRQVDCAFAIN